MARALREKEISSQELVALHLERIEAVNQLTIEDMKQYHNDFYGISNNASLIAIGNFDEEKLKSFFEANFDGYTSDKPFAQIPNKFFKMKPANEKLKTPDKKNAFTTGSFAFECNQYDEDYEVTNKSVR